MLIDLREFLSGSKDKLEMTASLGLEQVSAVYGCYSFKSKSDITFSIRKSSKDEIAVKGFGDVVLIMPCDRCLCDVEVPLSYEFERTALVPCTDIETQEDQDYIDGYNLDVDRLVYDEILLKLPGKVLCREDCLGLCPVCGHNLNEGECGCDREVPDPRMSVFKDIIIK